MGQISGDILKVHQKLAALGLQFCIHHYKCLCIFKKKIDIVLLLGVVLLLGKHVHCTKGQEHNNWNIQWTGALKNYLPPYKSYMPKIFDFLAMQRCVWLVKFLIPKVRREYMPTGPVQQKSTCPQSKLTCPGCSGSVMFLPWPYSGISLCDHLKFKPPQN